VKQLADNVNEYKRDFENSTKVLTIQQSISGKLPVKLFVPHRRFVREGKMSISIGSDKKLKDYYCVLFNDLFLIASKKKDVLTYKLMFSTKDIQVQDSPDIKGAGTFTFEMVVPVKGSLVTLRLVCSDMEEKMEWMRDITIAIANRISVLASVPLSSGGEELLGPQADSSLGA